MMKSKKYVIMQLQRVIRIGPRKIFHLVGVHATRSEVQDGVDPYVELTTWQKDLKSNSSHCLLLLLCHIVEPTMSDIQKTTKAVMLFTLRESR
jgi:hypothetical protein